jgi:hypothetical protein
MAQPNFCFRRRQVAGGRMHTQCGESNTAEIDAPYNKNDLFRSVVDRGDQQKPQQENSYVRTSAGAEYS